MKTMLAILLAMLVIEASLIIWLAFGSVAPVIPDDPPTFEEIVEQTPDGGSFVYDGERYIVVPD